MQTPTFVVLDFETADYGRDSACTVGIVKVQGAQIIHEENRLIRPLSGWKGLREISLYTSTGTLRVGYLSDAGARCVQAAKIAAGSSRSALGRAGMRADNYQSH